MSEESPHVWLIDNLAADFPRLRVWTYGYSPSLREQGSGEDILEFSHTFVLQLRLLRNALGVSQRIPLAASPQLTLKAGLTEASASHIYGP
jgi:hypothetical protein